jgi:hypothetical protein
MENSTTRVPAVKIGDTISDARPAQKSSRLLHQPGVRIARKQKIERRLPCERRQSKVTEAGQGLVAAAFKK